MRSLFFHFSNDKDHLYDLLVKELSALKPFEKVWVVVPSLAVKNSLTEMVSQKLGICMGIRFVTLQPVIYQLIEIAFENTKMPNHLELALKIQSEISKCVHQDGFEEIFEYLRGESNQLNADRLISLSDHLASQFVTYLLYVPTLSEQWKNSFSGHWQQKIWEKVFDPATEPHFFGEYTKSEAQSKRDLPKLFFFNFSFMPGAYFELIDHISQKTQTTFFQFSGCSHFWSDLHTSKDKSYLMRLLEKKGKNASELEELRDYLDHSHPLLANLGKLNRGWLKQIEEKGVASREHYQIPKAIENDPVYADHMIAHELELTNRPVSLLKKMQADMLLMRSDDHKVLAEDTSSIGVHQASSYSREVEILYHHLVELFVQKPHLKPSDVAVYVADIEKYIPYLEKVFLATSSQVPARIYDYPFSARNPVLKVILSLLEIETHRWDPDKLFDIFHQSAFMRKFHLTPEMLRQWHELVEELGPIMGYNEGALNDDLLSDYNNIQRSNEAMSSWQDVIETLIKHYCSSKPESVLHPHLEAFDFTSCDSFNALIEILDAFYADLTSLKTATMSFSSWAGFLEKMIGSYLYFESHEQKDFSKILETIRSFEQTLSCLDHEKFDFQTFYYYLKKALVDEQGASKSAQWESVSFYSLYNSSPLFCEVSCVLGLNDLSYPRQHVEHPLSLMPKFESTLYCPPLSDYDRTLFLEILWSTQDSIYLSYLGYCTETFKEVEPSILITELFNYLDQFYDFQGRSAKETLLKKHPHLPFSASYFKEKNYQNLSYTLAKSYYSKEAPKRNSMQHFFDTVDFETSIDLKEPIKIERLFALSKDPFLFGLRHLYGMDLEPFKLHHSHQNMMLSPLQKAMLKKDSLGEYLGDQALPKGHFRELAKNELCKQSNELQKFLASYSLKFENFFSVEFRSDVEKPIQLREDLWLVPSIKLDLKGRELELTGTLPNVSKEGLLSLSSSSVKSRLEQYPQYLVYSLLRDVLDLKSRWLFGASLDEFILDISHPEDELLNYMDFYFEAQKKVLPFLPTWIPHFLSEDQSKIKEQIQKDLQSPFFYHPYAGALISQVNLDELPLEAWVKKAKQFFEESFNKVKP